MQLTIFGASGKTGRHLAWQALAAGHHLTAVVRDPARLPVRHERLAVVVAGGLDPERSSRPWPTPGRSSPP